MWVISLKNGFTYEWRVGNELLDATVIETLDKSDLVADYKETKEILGFVKQPLLSPHQTFSSRYVWGGLSKKAEMELTKLREMTFWPKKGVYTETFAEKFQITGLLYKWLKHSKTIKGAWESVQASFLEIPKQVKDLYDAYDVTISDVLAKVYTEWFSISSAEWPGSATPKGQPLFSNNHPILDWDGSTITYSNLYWDTIDYNDVKSGVKFLQKAIDTLKTVKLDGWRIIKTPKGGYNLIIPVAREVYWKQVVNDGNSTSAVGSNSGIANQFLFKGNTVNIKVLTKIWEYDKILWKNIWNTNMAFVTNPDYLRTAEALKYYELGAPEVSNWEDKDTDTYYNKLACTLWADHYDAENWIYGYKGS